MGAILWSGEVVLATRMRFCLLDLFLFFDNSLLEGYPRKVPNLNEALDLKWSRCFFYTVSYL